VRLFKSIFYNLCWQKSRKAFYAAYVLFFLAFLSNIVWAGLKISPAQIELILDEEDVSLPVVVTNTGNFPINVNIRVAGTNQQTNGDIVNDKTESIYSGVRYIKIEPNNFLLNSDDAREVRVIFNKPLAYDWTGGLYATLFFEYGSGQKGENNSVAVLTKILSSHGLDWSGKITKVKVVQKDKNSPVDIYAFFKNNGNVHLAVSGKAFVYNKNGGLVGKVDMSGGTILPGEEDWLKGIWDPPVLPKGDYAVKCEASNDNKKILSSGETLFSVLDAYDVKAKKVEIIKFPSMQIRQKQPIPFIVTARNCGNTKVDAGGVVEIYNDAGGMIASVPLNTIKIDAYGTGEVKGELEEDIIIGKYKALAKIVYGDPISVVSESNLEIIEQTVVKEGKIVKFAAEIVKSGQPVAFSINFENEGNVPLVFGGTIKIKKEDKVFKELLIPNHNIEPKTRKEVKISCDDKLPLGLYKAEASISYGRDKVTNANTVFFVK